MMVANLSLTTKSLWMKASKTLSTASLIATTLLSTAL